LLQQAIAKAKEKFTQEKQDVLADTYKKHFNQIVVVKCGKRTLPGIIVNPYNVPPKPMRADWLKRLKNVSHCLHVCFCIENIVCPYFFVHNSLAVGCLLL